MMTDRATVKIPRRKFTGVWRGKLVDVTEESGVTPARTGKNKKAIAARPWTKFTIFTEDKVAFTTFSYMDALLARCSLEGKEPVEIQWKRDAYDGKSIVVIDEVKTEPDEYPIGGPRE